MCIRDSMKGRDTLKKRAWALALAFLLVLTGCGKKEEPVPDPEPPAAEEPIVTPEPEAEPEPAVPAGMNPLTGLPMEPEYERNRPVAVMLNNLKKAQPQLGNAQADIIYEVPAEGGITRMLAVYQTLDGIGTLCLLYTSQQTHQQRAQQGAQHRDSNGQKAVHRGRRLSLIHISQIRWSLATAPIFWSRMRDWTGW